MRRRPYTVEGVKRLKCFRCEKKARFQWQICADGNVFRPMCEACDVALNSLVLGFMGDPDRAHKIRDYKRKMEQR